MHVTLNSEINCKPCFRLKTPKTTPSPPPPPRERQSLVNYAAGSCGRDWSNIYVTSSIPATIGAQNINIYK